MQGITPAATPNAQAVRVLRDRLDSAIGSLHGSIIGLGTQNMATSMTPSAVVEDESLVAVSLARAAISGFDGLCASVQSVILSLATTLDAKKLFLHGELLRTIQRGRLTAAAEVLASTSWCNANQTRCSAATIILQSGCPTEVHWHALPSWHNATIHGIYLPDPQPIWHSHGKAEVPAQTRWQVAHARLNVTLELYGSVACGADKGDVGVTVRLVQNAAIFRFFRANFPTTLHASLPADAARQLADTLHVDALGMLHMSRQVTPGATEWWTDHDELLVRPDAIEALRNDPLGEVCDRASVGQHHVHMEMVFGGDSSTSPLLVRQGPQGPSDLAVAISGELTLPLKRHIAPSAVCDVICATPSHVLRATAVESRAASEAAFLPLSARLKQCLLVHAQRYATCGTVKYDADREFTFCAGGPSNIDELPVWWVSTLNQMSSSVQGIASAFDCRTFTATQRASCVCVEAQEKRALPADSYAQGASPSAISMGCLLGGVGRAADQYSPNRPQDLISVDMRLFSLGFLSTAETSAGDREHAILLFRCVIEGVFAFEIECDSGPPPCKVSGKLCERSTVRDTCLLDMPCTDTRIFPQSLAHDWLRARHAPSWKRLPREGVGFIITSDPDFPSDYGTSWLLDALTRAGHSYSSMVTSEPTFAYVAPLLRVTTVSIRQGGAIPGEQEHHTGRPPMHCPSICCVILLT